VTQLSGSAAGAIIRQQYAPGQSEVVWRLFSWEAREAVENGNGMLTEDGSKGRTQHLTGPVAV
jgi:hypothetical protein